jgi:Flp pilus assembly protein TadG
MTEPTRASVHRSRWRRWTPPRLRGDRGSSPVEFAIVASAMILIAFAVVQVGLVFYARSLALAAATQGVNAGRGFNAPTGTADAATRGFLDQAGDGLTDQNITVNRTATDVRVTVTGAAISVLPGVTFRISQTAHGSIEQPT